MGLVRSYRRDDEDHAHDGREPRAAYLHERTLKHHYLPGWFPRPWDNSDNALRPRCRNPRAIRMIVDGSRQKAQATRDSARELRTVPAAQPARVVWARPSAAPEWGWAERFE